MAEALRLLSKPKSFDGTEAHWIEWQFSFISYLGAIDDLMVKDTLEAMSAAAPIKLAGMTDDATLRRAALMFTLLAQLWSKRAAVLLRTIETGNGYEAMRRMENRIKEEAPGKALATLQSILGFEFTKIRTCSRP